MFTHTCDLLIAAVEWNMTSGNCQPVRQWYPSHQKWEFVNCSCLVVLCPVSCIHTRSNSRVGREFSTTCLLASNFFAQSPRCIHKINKYTIFSFYVNAEISWSSCVILLKMVSTQILRNDFLRKLNSDYKWDSCAINDVGSFWRIQFFLECLVSAKILKKAIFEELRNFNFHMHFLFILKMILFLRKSEPNLNKINVLVVQQYELSWIYCHNFV